MDVGGKFLFLGFFRRGVFLILLLESVAMESNAFIRE